MNFSIFEIQKKKVSNKKNLSLFVENNFSSTEKK